MTMGGLVISRADCRAISACRRTLTHFTVVRTVLCTGYVVNKTVSCVLMNGILMTMIYNNCLDRSYNKKICCSFVSIKSSFRFCQV
jgi:hypothetical protein